MNEPEKLFKDRESEVDTDRHGQMRRGYQAGSIPQTAFPLRWLREELPSRKSVIFPLGKPVPCKAGGYLKRPFSVLPLAGDSPGHATILQDYGGVENGPLVPPEESSPIIRRDEKSPPVGTYRCIHGSVPTQ